MKGKKPNGYWRSLENTLHEAREVLKRNQLSTLPSDKILQKMRYSSLCRAITKYHGGYPAFYQLLGQEIKQVENGRWKDLEYALGQAHKAMRELNVTTLPATRILEREGYSSLTNAIARYYGGFQRFRQLLGEKQKRDKYGLRKNLVYVLQEAERVVKTLHATELPPRRILEGLGYWKLAKAIGRYHGGYQRFRDLLRKHMGLPSEREKLELLLQQYTEQ